LFNTNFNYAEFGTIGNTAGSNNFVLFVKQNLVPKELTPKQAVVIYADEADVLNVALFGTTAKEWRTKNSDLKGNIRDYASIN